MKLVTTCVVLSIMQPTALSKMLDADKSNKLTKQIKGKTFAKDGISLSQKFKSA